VVIFILIIYLFCFQLRIDMFILFYLQLHIDPIYFI